MQKKVVVVGAGISGLACARRLAEHGCAVTVLEKSAGVGGRCATRRTEAGAFDHGAQYFTARDARFQALVSTLRSEGVVAPIASPVVRMVAGGGHAALPDEPRYAAVPGMNALGKRLAQDLDIRLHTRVTTLMFNGARASVWFEESAGIGSCDADALVLALPSDQAGELARGTDLENAVQSQLMTPCWAVMLAFDSAVDFAPAGALIDADRDPALAWVMRDSAKPGRNPGERWVLHARADWSFEHLDSLAETVSALLVSHFRELTGAPQPAFALAHRWRYAAGGRAADDGNLADAGRRLVACGDWANQGRIEGAWLSGLSAAERVRELLK